MKKLTPEEAPQWFNFLAPGGFAADKRGCAKREKAGKWFVGCEGCPLDQERLQKVIGLERVRGRRAMLWAQAPGKEENLRGLELIGPAGQWLWAEMADVGLKRGDFDIQNVVRCRPSVRSQGYEFDREPTSEEIAHCSGHTRAALKRNGGKARVHLVFGAVAAEVLLRKDFRKDTPIFWSERLRAKVFCFDHPSYFLRGSFPEGRYFDFCKRLAAAAFCVRHSDRYAYVQALPLRAIRTAEALEEVFAEIRRSGARPALDIEDGVVSGRRRILSIALSWDGAGGVFVALDHPENDLPEKRKRETWAVLKKYLEDPEAEKVWRQLRRGSANWSSTAAAISIYVL
jgi:uracil-DNA glycosylase family 4